MLKTESTLVLPVNFVNTNLSKESTKTNIQDKETIIYLGKEVFDSLKGQKKSTYKYLEAETPRHLYKIMHEWENMYDTAPSAILIDDSYLPTLSLENIIQERKKEIFRTVPVFVFTKKRDRLAIKTLNSLQIDDYLTYPINFDSIAAQINVFKSLKSVRISTNGMSNNRDFVTYKSKITWSNKRLFDIIISGGILTLLLPLLLIVAIAIKLESKGPIIYISKRAGKNYKIINFFKMRSMYLDADKKLEELKKTNNQYKDGNQQFVKIKDDPRVTKVGKFIRNTSIDEIPQLFNVLRGDMSIVGNRPLPLYEAELLTVDNHVERFLAPSGITGLWQVLKRGKGEMSSEERILLDRIYVRKNSFLFDLKIIFMTIPALLQSEKV